MLVGIKQSRHAIVSQCHQRRKVPVLYERNVIPAKDAGKESSHQRLAVRQLMEPIADTHELLASNMRISI